MSDAIIVAVISAAVTLFGVIINSRSSQQKMMMDFDKKLELLEQRVTLTIDRLSAEVKEHNNYARRMPVVEEQIKVANHRIEDLEQIAKALRN